MRCEAAHSFGLESNGKNLNDSTKVNTMQHNHDDEPVSGGLQPDTAIDCSPG